MAEIIIFIVFIIGIIYVCKFYSLWYLLQFREGYSNAKLGQIIDFILWKLSFLRNNNITFNINSSSEYNYSLKTENFLDRFFKLLGVSKELKTEKTEFDNEVYIISDDTALNQAIFRNKDYQDIITELFSSGINFVHCRNKKLWAIGKENKFSSEDEKNKVIFKLKELDSLMAKKLLPNNENNRRYKVMLNLFSITFVFFIISYILGIMVLFSNKLTYDGMLVDSLKYSLPLFAACMIFTILYFFRTSQAHIVLIFSLLGSLHIFMLGTYLVMYYANIYLDQSQQKIYYSEIIEKIKSGKKYKKYKVSIPHWNKNKDLYTTSVSAAEFERVKEGSAIKLTLRSGYLGYEWIENKEVIIK